MGRLPQTTEATTREDCTGTSRNVSEKPDAVGSGGNLHSPLHLLPHHQLCGDREGKGQRHPGPWRTQVSASQSVCRNCEGADWRKAGSRWCWSWPGEVSGGTKAGIAKGLLGAKLGLARTVLRPVVGIKRAKLTALRGLLDKKISLLDF